MQTSVKFDSLLVAPIGTDQWKDISKSTREATAKYTEADATKTAYNNILGKVIEESKIDGTKEILFQCADFSPELVQMFKGGEIVEVDGNQVYKAPLNGNQIIEMRVRIITGKGLVFDYPRCSISTSISTSDDDLHYLNVMMTVLQPEDESISDMSYTILSESAKSLNSITSFKIGSAVGVITGSAIAITVPAGTVVTALTPDVITSLGAVYTPQGAVDFTSPVAFKVKSVNNKTKTYTVTVTVAV